MSFDNASTLAFSWISPHDPLESGHPLSKDQEVALCMAGLFRRMREILENPDEAYEALLAELPYDTFETDAKPFDLLSEARACRDALNAYVSRLILKSLP